MKKTYVSRSPEETQGIGKRFSGFLKSGDTVALTGELGAGKTCFAKGVISSLCHLDADAVTSPTFTLIEEYEARERVYHVDLYRLDDPREADELPWDDLFSSEGITLIEWPEKIKKIFSHCKYEIIFIKTKKGERVIEINDLS